MNIKELAKKYNLSGSDFWELPMKKGTWILSHDACEKIADIEKITFEYPEIHNGTNSVAMIGKATKADKTIWSTGEANPQNCKNQYMWAMAEKRLKDRLTLKLINAYEYGIYSEEEADDFKKGTKAKGNNNTTIGPKEKQFLTKAITELEPEEGNKLNQWMKYEHTEREIISMIDAIESKTDLKFER